MYRNGPEPMQILMTSLPDNSRGQQFADFISLNRYYGWYVMGGYNIADAEEALRKELGKWERDIKRTSRDFYRIWRRYYAR